MAKTKVVAAILIADNRVLLCHRNADRAWAPNAWDLPGGHVEPHEAPPEALVRELQEELGIRVEPPIAAPSRRIEESEFELLIWVLDVWQGEVSNRDPSEHASVAWFAEDALSRLTFAHSSYRPTLIEALKTATAWSLFARRAGIDDAAEFCDVVEAVRLIPYGRPRQRTIEGLLKEWCGTCSTKHYLLALIANRRWPNLDPRIMHRVYTLTPTVARRLFGDEAADVVPCDGVRDVHTYLTAALKGRRVVIDATVPGWPWDGHSDMILACGEGTDFDAGVDPPATKERLVREFCDVSARDRIIESLSTSSAG